MNSALAGDKVINQKWEDQYFFVQEGLIPSGFHLFPFSIYIINFNSSSCNIISFPNVPFNKDDLGGLKESESLAILQSDKNAFFHFFKINPWDLEEFTGNLTEEEKDLIPIYKLKTNLNNALETQNFNVLLSQIREEIKNTFDESLSPSVSLCKILVEKTLLSDNITNRVVALSYSFAKLSKIISIQDLADLVHAAFFHHLGFTQLPQELGKIPQIEMKRDIEKDYKKHPFLALHLLKKADFPITPRSLMIITDHHERYDGKGFPDGKKSDKTHLLSYILGFSSHIVEFSNGDVNGRKFSLKHTVQMIKSRNSIDGLEMEFGPIIKEIIKDF